MYAVATMPRYILPRKRWGLGAPTQGQQQALAIGTSVATSGAAVASATGALAPLAATLGVSVPVLGAIVGAGIMGVSAAIEAIMNSGCGQTCILSTQFANQAEAALQKNIDAYFALPTPRPYEAQQAALSNFDTFAQWLQAPAQCGNPNLGNAGKRCISDRLDPNACVWRQPANKVPAWGTPPAGACWNWVNGYRDAIANDPNVAPPLSTTSLAALANSVGVPTTLPSFLSAIPAWLLVAVVTGFVVWAVNA